MKRGIFGLITLVIFGFAFTGFSQQKNATIAFEKLQHDFGKIMEEKGSVTCEFVFANTGSIPLIINRVVASCGCTSPDWSKAPVIPGGKGFVKATYNPRNRPGKFAKSVSVFSNAEKKTVVLKIMGEVIPRERTVEDDYPYMIGGLRFKSNHLAFVKVKVGQKKTILHEMINVSDSTMSITFNNVPGHVNITATPAVLKPKEKGILEVTYDAGKKNDWGFLYDRLNVLINGSASKNNILTVSATIEEDFSSYSATELANAARIEFEETLFNFGKMEQKSSVTHEFAFKNTGKSNLILRKISSSCGCTAVTPKAKVIAPGQASVIEAIFSSGSRRGRQNKSITIITNDPKNPTVILRVTGDVEATTSGN